MHQMDTLHRALKLALLFCICGTLLVALLAPLSPSGVLLHLRAYAALWTSGDLEPINILQQQQGQQPQLQQDGQLLLKEQLWRNYHTPIVHGWRYGNATQHQVEIRSWEEAVAGRAECVKGSLWQHLSWGSWYITREQELLYEPWACRLRRLAAAEVRQCLSNTTLTFVGDSLSRYQYLSLAYFVAHGKYMQRYADDGEPSLSIEGTFSNFTMFYQQGSAQLRHEDAAGKATEECDCHRLQLDATVRENRMLTIQPNLTTLPAAATARIAYRLAYGLRSNVVHETLQALRAALADQSTPRKVIVSNLGHWMGQNLPQAPTAAVMASLYEPLFNSSGIQPADDGTISLVWKTTTTTRQEAVKNNNPTKAYRHRPGSFRLDGMAQSYGWQVFDAYAVTGALGRVGVCGHWDNLHFLPFVYDQLNDVLLNGVC